MAKFMTKALIAVALMPVGYALGIMLGLMLSEMLMLAGSVKQVPTPIAAKPPTQIKAAPPPPAKLEAVIPNREFAQSTVRKADWVRCALSHSIAKANDVGSEQKPPAPPKYMCPLDVDRSNAVYYPDESEFCSHHPHVDPSWQRALVRHLDQYRNYLSKTQSPRTVLPEADVPAWTNGVKL
jgi:hypothetical protein